MATGEWGGALGPQVYQAKVTFRLGLSVCQWGVGFRSTAGNADITQGILDDFAPWVQANFLAFLTNEDRLVSCDVTNVREKTGRSFDYGNLAGTGSGAGEFSLPSMLAVVVSMKSGVRQRLGTGRFFLPVRNEGEQAAGGLMPNAITRYQAFVTAMAGEYIGENPLKGFRLANFHAALPERARTGRNPNNLPPLPATPARWYDVESLRLNTLITSLRSRKAGVGS